MKPGRVCVWGVGLGEPGHGTWDQAQNEDRHNAVVNP